MRSGVSAKVSALSSGAGGTIPPDATLIFDLELLELLDESSDAFLDEYKLLTLGGSLLVVLYVYFYSGGGKSVSASHILVADEADCTKLKKELDGLTGAGLNAEGLKIKFGELAVQHSTCPSGKKGGSLGTFAPGQMVPAFDKVCWSAPIGVVQGPIQTHFGFHLILVTGRTDPDEAKAK